jgi:phytoene dehydrogenase-like protein
MSRRACVIGAGPNGLGAAIVLTQAGLHVDVLEAEPTLGGAARTLELTLPGFLHDFGSAVHPILRDRHSSHHCPCATMAWSGSTRRLFWRILSRMARQ